jgi:hypothetical protein
MRPLSPELSARVAAVPHPVAVLDVDLTLVENAPRTRALLADFCRARCPELLQRVPHLPLAFSITRNGAALGLPDDLLAELPAFWFSTFFDPAYLAHDVLLEGAREAVDTLRSAGVTIVYLTARPAALGPATAASFAALGLPLGVAGTALVTKEDPRASDSAFKRGAFAWISRLGQPVLVADNEPGHVNAMADAFPEALAVHVATRHSEPAPPLHPRVRPHPSLLAAIVD